MNKVLTLNEILNKSIDSKYAVGSFSPRYISLIEPILKAAQELDSPVIVQISQKELNLFEVSLKNFADEFHRVLEDEKITVPVCLHLDHTKEQRIIIEAIEAGFTSVMRDASEFEFEENVRLTTETVKYAHAHNVSVEAELGKIGTTDFVESDKDETYYTNPTEAKQFIELTKCDALAVSVGTAHGVYEVVEPHVDLERLQQIGQSTETPLVLHGGSGVPNEMVLAAINLELGSIKKVNIATDLELAFLKTIERPRMLSSECASLPTDILEKGRDAVKEIVKDKMVNYLSSNDKGER